MSKLIIFLLISSLMFGQSEIDTAVDSAITEPILTKNNIGVLGYQFKNGKFYDARMSDSWTFQTGLFNFNSDNYIVTELPLLLKHDFTTNFRTFFGTKLELVYDTGLHMLQPPTKSSMGLGITADFGFQYDVSNKTMLELRFSNPIINQPIYYPASLNPTNSRMLFLGSGFKF